MGKARRGRTVSMLILIGCLTACVPGAGVVTVSGAMMSPNARYSLAVPGAGIPSAAERDRLAALFGSGGGSGANILVVPTFAFRPRATAVDLDLTSAARRHRLGWFRRRWIATYAVTLIDPQHERPALYSADVVATAGERAAARQTAFEAVMRTLARSLTLSHAARR